LWLNLFFVHQDISRSEGSVYSPYIVQICSRSPELVKYGIYVFNFEIQE
jgi:hypothetical protein